LKPEFTVTDLAKEKVIRYKVTVTEEMINEEVERLTLRHGNMTEPEAVTGDDNVLNVTFTETDEEGNVVPDGIKKENSLLVKYFSEEFRKTLIGRKAGDSVSLQIDKAFDAKEKEWLLGDLGLDAHDATAGTKFFNIDITKVNLVERAALDEKFFEAAFPGKGVKTEEEFRNTVKSEMESYWSSQSSNHLQHELYHVLLEHTTIDFPETFLKRWIQQGGEEPKSPEEADKEFPGFANQLKWTLITDKLVRDNGIDVKPEDIKDFAKKQLFGYMGMQAGGEEQPWLGEYLNRMMQDKKFVEDAYNRIQTDKVFGWAETQVNATEKPVTVEEFSKELDKHRHHHH
jgi:trigger factor